MKTKLVYVLTCAPEHHYIEWALISLCSLRRIHPESYTVLIVDDLTNELLVDDRAEILNYVSEKIVAYDCPKDMSLNDRSRFLKTSVRQRISGDFLFVDCDTIICRSVNAINKFKKISACLDSHLYLEEYNANLYAELGCKLQKIGIDINQEVIYFNSGIMFVPESDESHLLYKNWHTIWKDNHKKGIYQDQPSLALANKKMGYIIHRMSDLYNCIVYTQNTFIREAHILHISSFENPSYLFSKRVLKFIQENGINHKWVQWVIGNPYGTMLPFDNAIYRSTIKERLKWVREIVEHSSNYGKYIDNTFTDFPMQSRLKGVVRTLFRLRMYTFGALFWMCWKRLQLAIRNKSLKDNINRCDE